MEKKVTVSAIIPHENTYLYVCNDKDGKWSLPAGKVNPKESLESALKREVREEVCIEINICSLIRIYRFISDNNNDITNFVYYATIAKGKPRQGKGIREIAYLSPKQAHELIKKRYMRAKYANLKPVKDYEEGLRFPRDLVYEILSG